MPVVLIHGNPQTAAVWELLLAELSWNDVFPLSPPDWGASTPDGWGATVEEYRLWLAGELESIGEPVDLVGHDWGGGHALNVAMTRLAQISAAGSGFGGRGRRMAYATMPARRPQNAATMPRAVMPEIVTASVMSAASMTDL